MSEAFCTLRDRLLTLARLADSVFISWPSSLVGTGCGLWLEWMRSASLSSYANAEWMRESRVARFGISRIMACAISVRMMSSSGTGRRIGAGGSGANRRARVPSAASSACTCAYANA
eukprot:scaffold54249_cov50-Phaeocystis_antarctica.AAC.3